jgi:hypothetical protein
VQLFACRPLGDAAVEMIENAVIAAQHPTGVAMLPTSPISSLYLTGILPSRYALLSSAKNFLRTQSGSL